MTNTRDVVRPALLEVDRMLVQLRACGDAELADDLTMLRDIVVRRVSRDIEQRSRDRNRASIRQLVELMRSEAANGEPCTHRRGVCVATRALMNGEHGRYRGKVDWCPDCGAFRAVCTESAQATPWLVVNSPEVDVLYSKLKQRQRAAAEVLDA